MTLIFGMSKPEGLYMSVDYRLTNTSNGKLIDDGAVKHVTVHYPGDTKALLAFTGIAQLKDGTPVGEWLRETLRGHTESFGDSMRHVHERLNRDFATYRRHLEVVVMVMGEGIRKWGEFTNLKQSGYVSREFGLLVKQWTEPTGIAVGAPAVQADADGLFDLVRRQLKVRPRHVRDHMNMLATVNRRVAAADEHRAKSTGVEGAIGTVSPFCHVTFVNETDEYEPVSNLYTKPGDPPVPFALPTLLHGIDTSYVAKQIMDAFSAGEIPDLDAEEVNRHLRRRP